MSFKEFEDVSSIIDKEYLQNLVSNIVSTSKKEFEETVLKLNAEHEAKIVNAKEKAYNDAYLDFRDEFGINNTSAFEADDSFYKSVHTNDKLLKDSSKFIKEAVSWGSSNGYVTYYNSPLDREQTDEERKYAQTIAYVRAMTDPIIGSIPDAFQRFILGRGVKFRLDDHRAQAIIDNYWRMNNMEDYMKRVVWLTMIESEYFPIHFVNKITGEVRTREVQPEEISEIETNPEDKSSYLSFTREYTTIEDRGQINKKVYPSIEYLVQKHNVLDGCSSKYEGSTYWQSDIYVQYFKLMKNREVRSRVLLERVLRWAEWYKQWVIDRAIINHEKSRVVWILEILGTDTESWKKYKTPPQGGTVKISTPTRKWSVVNANINANEAKEDGLFLLYQVAAGVSIPLHVLTQRTSESVYSSIRKGEVPFAMAVMDYQDSFAESLLRPLFRFVLCQAKKAGALPAKIKVKKYVTEGIKSNFLKSLSEYRDNKITEERMVSISREIVEEFRHQISNSKDLATNLDAYTKALKECDRVSNLCSTNLIQIFESEAIKKSAITEAYKLVENGISVSIDSEYCPVDITYPDVVSEDVLEKAQVLEIYDRIGIASKDTLMSKAGLNPHKEKYMITSELDFSKSVATRNMPKINDNVDNNVDNNGGNDGNKSKSTKQDDGSKAKN